LRAFRYLCRALEASKSRLRRRPGKGHALGLRALMGGAKASGKV